MQKVRVDFDADASVTAMVTDMAIGDPLWHSQNRRRGSRWLHRTSATMLSSLV
jgi:hypothetical protein